MKKDMVIVHCSATPPSMDIGRKEIDQWHKDKGWSGIGYHYVIRRNGLIEKGRDLDKKGAHAKGYNDRVGICLVGGVSEHWNEPESNFTVRQLVSLDNLIAILRHQEKFINDDTEIVGHRDLPEVGKDCPCFNVKELFNY